MPHFLLIDDSFPINTRNRKILDSIAKSYGKEAKCSVITWDRTNDYTTPIENYHVYQKVSAYGNKTKKLLNLWGYRQFCHDTIHRLNPDVVIASHWNNLMLVPRLQRHRQMLVYENLDVPTESFLIRKTTTAIEHWHMRRVDLTIQASRFFTKLYSPEVRQLVLENKPTFQAPPPQEYTLHSPIRIAFIGLLRYPDILSNLIDAVRGDARFQLFFHGDGHARQYLEEYAQGTSNVIFTGRYAYEDVAKFYQQTDIVWAAYPNKDFNVKYAISNKFHESLAFGIPTVYANNTCLGDFVVEKHIGMAVDPYSVEAVKSLLEQTVSHHEDLRQMAHDMRVFCSKQTTWEEDFKKVINAIDSFFDNSLK